MNRNRFFCCAAVSLFLLLLVSFSFAQSTVGPRITRAVSDADVALLPGSVHPHVAHAIDQGSVSPNMPMQPMAIFFKPTAAQQADLDKLLAQQQDPGSANYRKWLPTRFDVGEKRMRAIVREILDRRQPQPPEEFLAIQVSRLNEALLVAFSAMGNANLKAVGEVRRLVRDLDRYHGFAGRGSVPRLADRAPGRPVQAGLTFGAALVCRADFAPPAFDAFDRASDEQPAMARPAPAAPETFYARFRRRDLADAAPPTAPADPRRAPPTRKAAGSRPTAPRSRPPSSPGCGRDWTASIPRRTASPTPSRRVAATPRVPRAPPPSTMLRMVPSPLRRGGNHAGAVPRFAGNRAGAASSPVKRSGTGRGTTRRVVEGASGATPRPLRFARNFRAKP